MNMRETGKRSMLFIAIAAVALCFAGCAGSGGGGGDGGPGPDTDGGDGGGGEDGAVGWDGAVVTVSGTITFDLVPDDRDAGLLYSNTQQKPAQKIVVESVSTDSTLIYFKTSTGEDGKYSVPAPSSIDLKIRAKAQMLKTDPPSWDFRIVDNTNNQSMYSIESAAFNPGGVDVTGKDLNAASGWTGTAYDDSKRAAGPFAILNTVYSAIKKIVAADATVAMPKLLINWSIKNRTTAGDKTKGDIKTSHYDNVAKQLYILGKENDDTDEYDDHVVAHEWGHYFEANFSRSDSLGSDHGSGEKLDPRVAFGEGFGNGFSGMSLDNPIYIDTKGPKQAIVGLFMNLDDANGDPDSIGWFSEDSVQYILYQWYKIAGLGFNAFYTVFTGNQKTTDAFTTIHTFAYYFRQQNPSKVAEINPFLTAKQITSTADNIWDSTATETNNGTDAKSLPVYVKLTGSTPVNVCTTDTFGKPNKFMNHRFMYVEITQEKPYVITATAASAAGRPNIWVTKKGKLVVETDNSASNTVSTVSTNFPVGFYTVDIYDVRVLGTGTGGQVCFDVSIN